jgi:uncharacterized protein (TIGR04562 family)
VNTIFHFRTFCSKDEHLARLLVDVQTDLGDELNPGDNRFSADSYRTIHFVVDLPVRLPRETLELAPAHARTLGSIVYVLCEFQVIDQDTEAANELGEASHARYKERQKAAVMRRLKIGTRELFTPPGASVKKAAEENVDPGKDGGGEGVA